MDGGQDVDVHYVVTVSSFVRARSSISGPDNIQLEVFLPMGS